MTEASPWGGLAQAAAHHHDDPAAPWRSCSGRLLPGLEMRIIGDDGQLAARDGHTVGEIELRGPWVTGRYLDGEPSGRFSEDGWLRTGDVGTLDRHGYFRITDRAKDVIKSGGEWIASVTLQDILAAHPDVLDAAVIGVPDPRWDERPLGVLVLREGLHAVPEDIREFVTARVPRWWVPERWLVVRELPRTSVGKLDKKALRASVATAQGALANFPQPPARIPHPERTTPMRYAELPTARATLDIAAPADTVWALVSDIALMAKLSEELIEVRWLDEDTEPAVGHRFHGRSYHQALGEWDSVSTVTEFVAPRLFTWEVNAGQDPAEPSSTWGFELRPISVGTELTQWGRIGPARSGLSYAIDRLPDKEDKIVRNRLREFQAGLESNLAAIKDVAEGRGH